MGGFANFFGGVDGHEGLCQTTYNGPERHLPPSAYMGLYSKASKADVPPLLMDKLTLIFQMLSANVLPSKRRPKISSEAHLETSMGGSGITAVCWNAKPSPRMKVKIIGNMAFRKLPLRLGLLAFGACILSGAEIGQWVARVDMAEVSPAYRSNLERSAPLPAKVGVSFLGENRLVVSSMDRHSHFDLAVDALDFGRTRLTLAGQLTFSTHASDAKLTTLPSGELIVNIEDRIAVLDAALRVRAEASAVKVCGSPEGLDPAQPFRVTIQAASERVAYLGIVPVEAGGRTPDGWACWFSALDLKLIALARSKHATDARSAHDFQVDTIVNGSSSLTPTGERRLLLPQFANCNISEMFPTFFLLHAQGASVVPCRKSAVSILLGEQIQNISLKGSRDWNFETDAWDSPLLIVGGGNLHIVYPEGSFRGVAKAVLVNYRTGSFARFPDIQINAPPPVYGGQTVAYAISPSGHYVAVLCGSMLTVYETPPGLLNDVEEPDRLK